MGIKLYRSVWVGLVATFCLVFTLVSSPSDPATPERPVEHLDLEEVLLLGELVEWIAGTPAEGGRFHAFGADDLSTAIRSKARSFELFRHYNGTEASRKLLRQVPYGDAIYRSARRHEIDSLLLAAVVEVESGFRPAVISPAGAVGLTQLMPETAQWLGSEDPVNPESNLDGGARYLRWLLNEYDGDLELALAGYNAGPGNVQRFGGVPPFHETRTYVDRVLRVYLDHHQEVWRTSGPSEFRALAGVS